MPNINEEDYPPKVIEIAKQVVTLSIFEAVELSECASIRFKLKNPFFMSTGQGVSMSAGTGSAAPTAEAPKAEATAQEKAIDLQNARFNVKLTAVEGGVKAKFAIMKLIGALNPDLSLAERKELVDKLPSQIAKTLPNEDANDLAAKLKEAGGTVELESA